MTTTLIEPCHPDCGPIVERRDGHHAHENVDGICWHPDTPDSCVWTEGDQCVVCLDVRPDVVGS